MSALGTKHHCSHCETRFYDLNKDPAVCPKCGTIAHVQASPSAMMYRMDDVSTRRHPMHHYDDDEIDLGRHYEELEELDEDDIELGSLSELDERERPSMLVGHDDDVREDTLMDDLDHDVLLDDARDAGIRT
jgi:uncharacterized protein (TIGR02300 family)